MWHGNFVGTWNAASCPTGLPVPAAHLVDHAFPPLQVRQCVLSVPKRLGCYLEREPKAVSAVLHIFLRVIEAHLLRVSDATSPRARLSAVIFVHRLKASLNRHVHYRLLGIHARADRVDQDDDDDGERDQLAQHDRERTKESGVVFLPTRQAFPKLELIV